MVVSNNGRKVYLQSSFRLRFLIGVQGELESRVQFGAIAARRLGQRYTYRVLQTIQMRLILLCVWAEQAVLGRAKTALKFKYEI
jgi:hypothetical protein